MTKKDDIVQRLSLMHCNCAYATSLSESSTQGVNTVSKVQLIPEGLLWPSVYALHWACDIRVQGGARVKLELLQDSIDLIDPSAFKLNENDVYVHCGGTVVITLEEESAPIIDLRYASNDPVHSVYIKNAVLDLERLGLSFGGNASGSSGIKNHEGLDTLTHEVVEDTYQEVIRVDGRVTSIVYYTDSGKSNKIRETNIIRTSGKISEIEIIQYDSNGQEKYTYTGVLTRSLGKVVGIDWSKV
jgi:hypothetical protein